MTYVVVNPPGHVRHARAIGGASLFARIALWLFGYDVDGSDADYREAAHLGLRVVAFEGEARLPSLRSPAAVRRALPQCALHQDAEAAAQTRTRLDHVQRAAAHSAGLPIGAAAALEGTIDCKRISVNPRTPSERRPIHPPRDLEVR